MASGAMDRGIRTHGWVGPVVVLALGALGAYVGWIAATTMVARPSSLPFAWVLFFAAFVAMTAGPLVGVFVGILALRVLRREAVCPRCGTGNPRSAERCTACDLALMPLEVSRIG